MNFSVISNIGLQGLPCSTVQWGPWAGAGMASSPHLVNKLRRAGLDLIAPEDGLHALSKPSINQLNQKSTTRNLPFPGEIAGYMRHLGMAHEQLGIESSKS